MPFLNTTIGDETMRYAVSIFFAQPLIDNFPHLSPMTFPILIKLDLDHGNDYVDTLNLQVLF